MPQPPALLLSKKQKMLFIGSLNSSTSLVRLTPAVSPLSMTLGQLLALHTSSIMLSTLV